MGQEYNNPFYFSKYNILSRTSYSRIGLYLNTELKFSSNSDFFTDFILSMMKPLWPETNSPNPLFPTNLTLFTYTPKTSYSISGNSGSVIYTDFIILAVLGTSSKPSSYFSSTTDPIISYTRPFIMNWFRFISSVFFSLLFYMYF